MMMVQTQSGAAMLVYESDNLDSARKPETIPWEQRAVAHHPVVPEPEDMCPQKRKVLDAALGDSYSADWVHRIKD